MRAARIYCAVAQPVEGGVPVTAITTVHKDDYDELLEAYQALVAEAERAPDPESDAALIGELAEVLADVTRYPRRSHPGRPAVSYEHRSVELHDRAMALLARAGLHPGGEHA